MGKNWNWIDRIIAAFRYSKVNRYVETGAVIADIGCGREGAFLLSHAKRINHGYGFDLRIQTHEESNVSLINNKESGGTLPLKDESVDAVFLNAVLEHLEEPVDVVSEAARILRRGGRIIMTTPTRMAKPLLEFLAYRVHLISEEEIHDHKHYFNKTDIANLVIDTNEKLYQNNTVAVSLEKYGLFELGLNSLIVLNKK